MTVELGIGMFVYNMIALCIGAILVYIVINRNNREWYILTPLQRQDTISWNDRKNNESHWHNHTNKVY